MESTILANNAILRISQEHQGVREHYRSDGTVRHKCFLSYYSEDGPEVLDFVERFSEIFIPRAVGVSEDYPWIDSDDDSYVMDVIRDDFLADSTVTISLVGRCTWSRKFVDWEIYSSLRRDRRNRLNGLLAIELPSIAKESGSFLPSRVSKNVIRDDSQNDLGYARYHVYPSSDAVLQNLIEDAFQARTSRNDTIVLGGPRRMKNSTCD